MAMMMDSGLWHSSNFGDWTKNREYRRGFSFYPLWSFLFFSSSFLKRKKAIVRGTMQGFGAKDIRSKSSWDSRPAWGCWYDFT